MDKIKTILVANNHLKTFGGSETYTYTLAKELVKQGYEVEYFTFHKGDFSEKLESDLAVKFMSKAQYDVILANHNTCVKFLKGKGCVIQTCHGIYPELEQPSIFADFHVSISQEVSNHLALQGFNSCIIMNGIDTSRFVSKKEINKELTNVLSLCQSEEANDFLKEVCDSLNLNFNYLNKFENGIWNVEDLINENDLVIGLGRSAYEAMACGRPVLIFDKRPYSESFADGYVVDKLANSLVNNCSGRFYRIKMTKEQMIDEFKKYKSNDGKILQEFIISNSSIDLVVDRYIDLAKKIANPEKKLYRQTFFKFLKLKFGIERALRILKFTNRKYFNTIN